MKKNNDKENKEMNFYQKFKWKCDNISGYKELMKLIGYLVFVIILIILINIYRVDDNKNNKNQTTTTKEPAPVLDINKDDKKLSYGDMLNNILNYKDSIKLKVVLNNDVYIINYTKEDDIYKGYIREKNGLKEFVIEDGLVYEIKDIDKKEESTSVLNNINLNYVIISKLVDELKSNQSIKSENELDTYQIYNLKDKEIKVHIKENKIIEIEINEGENTYTYYFEK